jgi:hypothetical protein
MFKPVGEKLDRIAAGHWPRSGTSKPDPLLDIVVGNMARIGRAKPVQAGEIDCRFAGDAKLHKHGCQEVGGKGRLYIWASIHAGSLLKVIQGHSLPFQHDVFPLGTAFPRP